MLQRTRTSGGFETHPSRNHINYILDGSGNPLPDYVVPLWTPEYGARRTTVDVVSPDAKKRMNDGEIINNPFHTLYEQQDVTFGDRSFVQAHTPYAGYWKVFANINLGVGTHVNAVDIDVDPLIKSATTKCLANVDKPVVQGLAILGELHKTLGTLRDPFDSIRKLLKRIDDDPWSLYSRRSAKDLADQHLTILYGIRPFMHDIEGLLDVLTSTQKKPKRKTARATAGASDTTYFVREYHDPLGEMQGEVSCHHNRSVLVRAYALYETKVELGLQGQLGMRLQDIPEAAWELATLSFLVDWFLNIGDILGALRPSVGINYLAQGYTVLDQGSSLEQLSGDALTVISPYYTGKGGGDTVNYSYIRKDRIPTELASSAGLAFQPHLNTTNILASISLIIQRLKSPRLRRTNRYLLRTRGVPRFT